MVVAIITRIEYKKINAMFYKYIIFKNTNNY